MRFSASGGSFCGGAARPTALRAFHTFGGPTVLPRAFPYAPMPFLLADHVDPDSSAGALPLLRILSHEVEGTAAEPLRIE
jgi:hypothetical protein